MEKILVPSAVPVLVAAMPVCAFADEVFEERVPEIKTNFIESNYSPYYDATEAEETASKTGDFSALAAVSVGTLAFAAKRAK